MEREKIDENLVMGSQEFILFPLVLFTSTLSGVFGMAGGMILMAGLLMFYGPVEAIFLHGILQFFANFQRYYQLRSHFKIKLLSYYIAGSVVAFVLLMKLEFRPSEQAMYIFLGLGALMGVFRPSLPFSLKDKGVGAIAGFVVTSMQIAGVSGAILDILCQDKRWSRFEVMALKSAAISISHLLKVFFMFQLMSVSSLKSVGSFSVLPFFLCAVFLGTYLGKKILDRLSDKNFFKCTSVLLLIIAGYYFFKAF